MVIGVINSEKMAQELNLPVFNEVQEDYCLVIDEHFVIKAKNKPEIKIDFTNKKNRFLLENFRNQSFPLVKACGAGDGKVAIDATAGFGKDAFLLSCFGYYVHLIEKSKILYLLLENALENGKKDNLFYPILNRMELHFGDSIDLIPKIQNVDLIYLDPMFGIKTKGLPGKEMQFLQKEAFNSDNLTLLQVAKNHSKKVVVKRSRKDSPLGTPKFQKIGKSNRFDVY